MRTVVTAVAVLGLLAAGGVAARAAPTGGGTAGGVVEASCGGAPPSPAANTTLLLPRGCTIRGPLTINAAGVILGAWGTGPPPVVTGGITVSGANDTVRDLAVTGAHDNGIEVHGPAALVAHVEVSHSGGGVEVWPEGAGSRIDATDAHDLQMILATPGGDDDYGAVGYTISGPRVTLSNSTCEHCRAPSPDYGFDGGFVEVWNDASGLHATGNRSADTGGWLETGGDRSTGPATGMRFDNNVIVDPHGSALQVHTSGTYAQPVPGLTFDHNTVVAPDGDSRGLFTDAPGATITNNIVPPGTPVSGNGNVAQANPVLPPPPAAGPTSTSTPSTPPPATPPAAPPSTTTGDRIGTAESGTL